MRWKKWGWYGKDVTLTLNFRHNHHHGNDGRGKGVGEGCTKVWTSFQETKIYSLTIITVYSFTMIFIRWKQVSFVVLWYWLTSMISGSILGYTFRKWNKIMCVSLESQCFIKLHFTEGNILYFSCYRDFVLLLWNNHLDYLMFWEKTTTSRKLWEI